MVFQFEHGDGVTQLTDQQLIILCLPSANFSLGLKNPMTRTHPLGSFQITRVCFLSGTVHLPHHYPAVLGKFTAEMVHSFWLTR